MGEVPATGGIAIIVTASGDLLLHHRDDKPGIAHPDCWAGFGGALEDGETVEEALHREVREETGLEIESPILLAELLDRGEPARARSGARRRRGRLPGARSGGVALVPLGDPPPLAPEGGLGSTDS